MPPRRGERTTKDPCQGRIFSSGNRAGKEDHNLESKISPFSVKRRVNRRKRSIFLLLLLGLLGHLFGHLRSLLRRTNEGIPNAPLMVTTTTSKRNRMKMQTFAVPGPWTAIRARSCWTNFTSFPAAWKLASAAFM